MVPHFKLPMIEVYLQVKFPNGQIIENEKPIGLISDPSQMPDMLRKAADHWEEDYLNGSAGI